MRFNEQELIYQLLLSFCVISRIIVCFPKRNMLLPVRWDVSPDLNLHTHVIKSESCDSDGRPCWLVVWSVMLQIFDHGFHSLIVDWDVVWSDEVYILPASTPSNFDIVLDVLKRLRDLSVDFTRDLVGLAIPSACITVSASRQTLSWKEKGKPTLAGTLDSLSNADGLAVPKVLFASLSVAFVAAVSGEVSHYDSLRDAVRLQVIESWRWGDGNEEAKWNGKQTPNPCMAGMMSRTLRAREWHSWRHLRLVRVPKSG